MPIQVWVVTIVILYKMTKYGIRQIMKGMFVFHCWSLDQECCLLKEDN